MNIANTLTDLVGNTPLLLLEKYMYSEGACAQIIGKLEFFNPLGSIKDRVALALINAAEAEGFIEKDSIIVEPTSGNTGIGLAFICAVRGYRLILTMPDSLSIERRKLLKYLGAEIVLTPGSRGMTGAVEKAEEIVMTMDKAYMPQQFNNPASPEIHRRTTAAEIWQDTAGKIDIFVAGVGTGGTITGVGEFLKQKNPDIKIVAVEPKDSPVLSEGKAGPHGIQGIGAGFIPQVLNINIIDEIIAIETEAAISTAQKLAKLEGLLVGISSGAAVHAAAILAKRTENKDKNIVVILPDTGERYLSTKLFE